MKKLIIILLIGSFILAMGTHCVEAKSKSFTIRVSCVVPARLEMSTPSEALKLQESTAYSLKQVTPTRIQTQETKIVNGNKTLFYTVVAR